MTTLTLRRIKKHFVVTGADIVPMRFESRPDQGCGDCPMLGSAIGAPSAMAIGPAKSAFFRFNAIGLMLRSTTLQSISTRPSSTK